MATIRDVARRAGVSISTVSHVLNGTASISAPVRQLVLDAARDLYYRPNALARSLLSGRTHSVGLIVSDITNPFYGEMLHALERRLSRNGYEILLCNADYHAPREHAFVQSLLFRRVDAVMISVGHQTVELAAELARHHVPTVVHWPVAGLPGVHSLELDLVPGMTQAADHLMDLGHRRLALLTGPSGLATADVRRDLFLAAVARRGIDPASVLCVESNFRMEGARHAVRAMLRDGSRGRPTAIMTGNDLMAFGALQALREAGLRVPQDMSVVGFDDVAFARAMNPPLTTVRLSSYRHGLVTARLLLRLLAEDADRNAPGEQTVLPTRLIVRDSTAPSPAPS